MRPSRCGPLGPLLRMRGFLRMPSNASFMLRSAACPEEPSPASSRKGRLSKHARQRCSSELMCSIFAAVLAAAMALAQPASAEDRPKYGGTLTYMIPADAPPSFDAHREETYATI